MRSGVQTGNDTGGAAQVAAAHCPNERTNVSTCMSTYESTLDRRIVNVSEAQRMMFTGCYWFFLNIITSIYFMWNFMLSFASLVTIRRLIWYTSVTAGVPWLRSDFWLMQEV